MGDKYKRLAQILDRLYQGQELRINALSKEFQVSTKTIQRDFKEGLKSDFLVREGNAFRLKASKKDQREAFVLDVLENLACGIGGKFQEDVCEILEKLHSLNSSFQVPLLDVSNKAKEITKIQDALKNHSLLSFVYKGREHQIKPLGLYAIKRSIYLSGIVGDEKRFFRLEEMQDCKLSKKKMMPSTDQNQAKDRIVLFVYAQASSYFQSLSWGEDQKIICDGDQNLIVEFSCDHQEAILQEILSQIPHVVVLEPQSLKERIERRILAYIKKSQTS